MPIPTKRTSSTSVPITSVSCTPKRNKKLGAAENQVRTASGIPTEITIRTASNDRKIFSNPINFVLITEHLLEFFALRVFSREHSETYESCGHTKSRNNSNAEGPQNWACADSFG